MPPLISIVLPNWNTKAHIIDFLDSVALQIYPKSALEVIIADNGSSDGSQEAIRQWYSRHMDEGWHRLELIELNENCGIAFAYNTAYHDCSPESEAILRGESDVIWDINLVNVLTKALFSRPDAGVVGARGVNFNSPDRIDHAARYINWWTGHLSDRDPETLVVCDCVFGGTFLIRRSSLDRMGFFFHIDRFLASELDLCTRIKKLDQRVLYEPLAVAYHKIARSTGKVNRAKLQYVDQKELTLFHLEHNRFPQKVCYLFFTLLFCIKQMVDGFPMPVLGFKDGLLTAVLHRPIRLPGMSPAGQISLARWLAD